MELSLFPCSATLPNCGFTTMKFSGSLPFRNRPPLTPVNADVLFNQFAKFATSPLASHWLVVVNRLNACAGEVQSHLLALAQLDIVVGHRLESRKGRGDRVRAWLQAREIVVAGFIREPR